VDLDEATIEVVPTELAVTSHRLLTR
jgi:hypothetical protein